MAFSDIVFSKIETNKIFEKYNRIYSIDFLEILNFKKNFKWSTYYFHISKVSKTLNNDSVDFMYGVELLGLSARIMDDFLDKDTALSKIVSMEHLSLLSTELLVESLEIIGHNIFFDYGLLKNALNSELIDYSTVINSDRTIDFYFEHILPKSTNIFQLITKLASHNNLFLDEFAIHYGTMVQIKNDISGILDKNSMDIPQLKNTLPLIASVTTLDSDQNSILLSLINKQPPLIPEIWTRIMQTGSIDFCKALMLSEKNKSIAILNKFDNIQEVLELKKYLELDGKNL